MPSDKYFCLAASIYQICMATQGDEIVPAQRRTRTMLNFLGVIKCSDFRHFRAPVRLPENVVVDVVIVTKVEGRLQHRVIAEELTAQYDDLGLKQERDAFDTLFDHAPDKLQVRRE